MAIGYTNVQTLDGTTKIGAEVDGSSVKHQRFILADDPRDSERVARVLAAEPALADEGIVTRTIGVPEGGYVVSRRVSTADTNLGVFKASPGSVHGGMLINRMLEIAYLKLYDKATTPVLASDTPLLVIPITPSAVATPISDIPLAGIPFASGIAFAIVKGLADNDETPVTAGDILAQVYRK